MRKYLKNLLKQPVDRWAKKYSTSPDKDRVYEALSTLHQHINQNPGKKGAIIDCRQADKKFIIFSDHHKGTKNGSDDFAQCESNYLTALNHYDQQGYHLVILGDCEELWENTLDKVIEQNRASIELEQLFIRRMAYTRIFGNHDLYWDNNPLAPLQHEKIFGQKIDIYEGLVLLFSCDEKEIQVFLTHGHQGDKVSDGNAFSKWFVANVWAPFQNYLELNPNTPAYDDQLKTEHNLMMYGWSALQPNLLLITGHTHQPVFESLTYLERLYRALAQSKEENNLQAVSQIEAEISARQVKGETIPDFTAYQPCYFNSGCCCFSDGDITGIEIEQGSIRLVKWKKKDEKIERIQLEEIQISACIMREIN